MFEVEEAPMCHTQFSSCDYFCEKSSFTLTDEGVVLISGSHHVTDTRLTREQLEDLKRTIDTALENIH